MRSFIAAVLLLSASHSMAETILLFATGTVTSVVKDSDGGSDFPFPTMEVGDLFQINTQYDSSSYENGTIYFQSGPLSITFNGVTFNPPGGSAADRFNSTSSGLFIKRFRDIPCGPPNVGQDCRSSIRLDYEADDRPNGWLPPGDLNTIPAWTMGTFNWNSGTGESITGTMNLAPAVPIPATAWLFGSAVGMLMWVRRKPSIRQG